MQQDLTQNQPVSGKTVLVSGANGLIGGALCSFLRGAGHTVKTLSRHSGDFIWDPEHNICDIPQKETFDVVIHLAGEGIAEKRWSQAQKKRIRDSRVDGTALLVKALRGLLTPPRHLLVASAIGIYGERGGKVINEESQVGSGYLPTVGVEWEDAAKTFGENTTTLRFGIVLSPRGGALKKMLPAFRCGVGGKLGSGAHYMSWITLPDAVRAIAHCVTHHITGPVNIVSPNSVTNSEFTSTLGKVLRRPVFFPVPSFILKILFGEMAQDLLLSSTRVEPTILKNTGFIWEHPELLSALTAIINQNKNSN